MLINNTAKMVLRSHLAFMVISPIVIILPIRYNIIYLGSEHIHVAIYYMACLVSILIAQCTYVAAFGFPSWRTAPAYLSGIMVMAILIHMWLSGKNGRLDFSGFDRGEGVASAIVFGLCIVAVQGFVGIGFGRRGTIKMTKSKTRA